MLQLCFIPQWQVKMWKTSCLTDILGFFFKPLFWMNSGPGMQLTTAGMPPSQLDVALGLLNCRGQAARWISVPAHATEWTWKWFFWRSKYNLEEWKNVLCPKSIPNVWPMYTYSMLYKLKYQYLYKLWQETLKLYFFQFCNFFLRCSAPIKMYYNFYSAMSSISINSK